jgi:protein SCO1/2
MNRITVIIAAGLLLAAAAFGADLPGNSLYQLPASFSDQNGKSGQIKQFAGRYMLVAMIYTHCKEMCPMTVESMRKIAADWQTRSREPIGLLLISFDSDRDKPAVLKAYAASHDLPPELWTLLQGDSKAVRRLAAALGVNYQKMDNGDWNHANLVTLLDKDGRVVLQQAGFVADTQDFFHKIKELNLVF